jgi:enhancing lycopene biosynthesis protein 2
MPISQVALSNTFNEFRSTFNDAANTVNSFTAGTGEISANTITSATLTSGRVPLVSTAGLIVDDSNLTYNTSTDILTLGGATDASSTTTGTLIVTGGVGVAKKLYVGTDLNVTANTTLSGTTDSSSSTTGAVIISGGAGVAKNVYVGGIVDVANTTQSTSNTTGALIVDGGAGIAKNLFVGGIIDVTDTTQSTGVTTGALIVDGGAGIAKNLYVGGDMQVTGNITILGSNSAISTTQINIEDNMLQIANNNVANTVDVGFFGQYSDGAGNVHSGFFRDASDGTWKLFKDYNVEPSTTIDVSGNGFAYANLIVDSLQANNKITTTGGVDKLTYATGAISVAGSSTPSNGQVLTATGSTTATWQTPSSGGGVTTGKAIAMALVFGG